MAIRTEPTLLCDNCFTPIEAGERFFNIYSAELVRVENPAYSEAFADYRDVKADTYVHGACFVPAVEAVLDGVDEALAAERVDAAAMHECGPDCESDAAEPVEGNDCFDLSHPCCGDADCFLCHASVDFLARFGGGQ